jgi:hypothetical protein
MKENDGPNLQRMLTKTCFQVLHVHLHAWCTGPEVGWLYKDWGYFEKNSKNQTFAPKLSQSKCQWYHLPPNCLNQNVNGTICPQTVSIRMPIVPFAPNCVNPNANGTVWKLVSRASQWVSMLRGFDILLEFSSFLFSHYGDQGRPLLKPQHWYTFERY